VYINISDINMCKLNKNRDWRMETERERCWWWWCVPINEYHQLNTIFYQRKNVQQ